MRILYGHTTLTHFEDGEFFAIPLWVLGNEFNLSEDAEEDITKNFLELPLEEKQNLMRDCLDDMRLTFDEKEIESSLTQSKIDYFDGKIIDKKYLVIPEGNELSIIDLKTLGKIYEGDKHFNINSYLLDSKRQQHVKDYKVNRINHYSIKTWNAFKIYIESEYNKLIQRDKNYYGTTYN